MARMRLGVWLVGLIAVCLLVGCGDDDSNTGTDAGIDASVDDMSDGMDTSDDVGVDEGGDSAEDTTDGIDTSTPADTFEVYTDPAVFAVVKLNPDLREIVYMKGARFIHLPDMKIRAETLSRDPIVGQTIGFTFAYPGSRSEPATSVTDEEGLTEVLRFVLSGDMGGDSGRLFLTPYFIGTEPAPLSERNIDAIGLDLLVVPPTDAAGDPIPLVADGTSTYTFEITLTRADGLRMPPDLEVEMELLLNQGSSPLAFEGSAELTQRWPVDQDAPTLSVNLVSAQAGAATARYRLGLYQVDANHGDRTDNLALLAP